MATDGAMPVYESESRVLADFHDLITPDIERLIHGLHPNEVCARATIGAAHDRFNFKTKYHCVVRLTPSAEEWLTQLLKGRLESFVAMRETSAVIQTYPDVLIATLLDYHIDIALRLDGNY